MSNKLFPAEKSLVFFFFPKSSVFSWVSQKALFWTMIIDTVTAILKRRNEQQHAQSFPWALGLFFLGALGVLTAHSLPF